MNYVELLINKPSNAKLDLDSEVNIGLQYSIADIRDISKRNSAYSKTIILPGTKNNNYWMGNLFDVNADFTGFNPNRKTDARLLVNSETVIDGFLQLRKINKLVNADMQGNLIQYEIVIYNNAVDFMTELGEKTINELDLSEFGHTFSIDTIVNSWDNTYQNGYVYPMYGTETSPDTYNADWFWPSMFYYTLLDRTLYEAGFGWTGSLKTNSQFQNEILAYVADGRPKVPEEERRRREFRAGYTASTTIPMGTFSGGTYNQSSSFYNYPSGGVSLGGYRLMTMDDDFTLPNFDNAGTGSAGNWDTTTYEWEVDRNGIFGGQFLFEGIMELYNPGTVSAVFDNFNDSGNPFIRYRTEFKVIIEDQAGNRTNWALQNTNGAHKFQPTATVFGGGSIELDGFTISAGASYPINIGQNQNNPSGNGATFSQLITLPTLGGDNTPLAIGPLSISDRIFIEARIGRQGETSTSTTPYYFDQDLEIRLVATDNTYFKNQAQTSELTQGDYLDLAGYLPDKTKQKDLVKDLITRYNLYISVDPDNEKLLIMDTRPDYYNAGEVLDWTDKKDYSSEDNIELLSELQFKEMLFTWKKDDDQPNKDYTAATGDVYGQFEYEFDNDFVKGVKKLESPFSPTPMIRADNIGAYLPYIMPDAPKIKPRVLYWGGLKDTDEPGAGWSIDYINTTNGLPGTWNNTSINGQYPYSGHFDDPLTPTLDINFGTCKYYFYNDYEYLTNNNMFNTYWNDYAKQIEGGRLVTSKFDLNEVDIRYIKENFNSKIFVLDSYYYVNKIIDYSPLKNQVTQVELIKIVEGLAWEGQEFGFQPGATANPGPVRPTPGPWPVRPVRPVKPIKDWGFGNNPGLGGFIPGGNNNFAGGSFYKSRVDTDWILDCGRWDDSGFWRDTSFWIDTPEEAGCGIIYKSQNLQFLFGDNNTTLANQNYVFGDRNYLESTNISVIGGSDNYITAGNVTLIQSQGLTVSEPNQVYLGNSFSVNTETGDVNIQGDLFLPYKSVTSTYSVASTDYYVSVEGTDTGIVLTLPEGDEIGKGKQLHIKNLMNGKIPVTLQVATGSSEKIDDPDSGSGGCSSIILDQYDSVALVTREGSDTQTGWIII